LQSINFEPLRASLADLAELGAFAEQYAHNDPGSTLVKLRMLAERMVRAIYDQLGMVIPPQPSLNDMLLAEGFKSVVPNSVRLKFNAIRDHGNKAAHGESVSSKTALWLLREAHDLAQWYFLTYLNGSPEQCGAYKEPSTAGIGAETKSRLKDEKRAALEKLASQETRLDSLLTELDITRTKAEAAEKQLADFVTASRKAQSSADVLKFSEASTRKFLIDSQLVSVGWNIGGNGTNTDDVTQEHEVAHQPTTTGIGYADYVLWDDNGKPLAVIEAKKTAESAEKGQTQARIYADGLDKMYGQRPVIFYTNGFDIWIWDDAQNYPPRPIFGFYSKDSLQYLVHQRGAKKSLDEFVPKKEIVDRLYQIEAVRRVTERFTGKRRKALIVQATGTGKTRVAVALAELLIRAGWVKRALFLCDRRELRKQYVQRFCKRAQHEGQRAYRPRA